MNACDGVRRHAGEKGFSHPLAAVPRLQTEGGNSHVKSSGLRGSTFFVIWEQKQPKEESKWCFGFVTLGRGGEMSADVGGPCLTPWLMAIGHRLSHLYFFCSLALSFQVSHWSSALRHRIIYCCQESWGQRGRKGGGGCRRSRVLQREGS